MAAAIAQLTDQAIGEDNFMGKYFWYIFTVVCFSCGIFCYKHADCQIRWLSTGYEVKYRFIAGCLVQQQNGKWLPEAKVRSE
jgi:hypothetical protein